MKKINRSIGRYRLYSGKDGRLKGDYFTFSRLEELTPEIQACLAVHDEVYVMDLLRDKRISQDELKTILKLK